VAGFQGAQGVSAQISGVKVAGTQTKVPGTQTDTPQANTHTQKGPSSPADEGEHQERETGSVPQPSVFQPEAKEATEEKPQRAQKKPQRKTDPCATARVGGETWLDQTHKFVEKNLCEPAVWFDNFFGEDRVLKDVRPGVLVKWKNAARWTEGSNIDTEGSNVDYVSEFCLQLRLPKFEKSLKKVRLLIVSGSGFDKFTTQPGQPVSPGVDPETGTRNPIVGLRVDFFKWFRSLVSIDTGIKIRVPPDPFTRMRYQYTKPFGDAYLTRFTETALWRYTEHFTETVQLDLEQKITTFTLLRWSNYMTYAEDKAGITLNTGISLIRQLTHKSAISYDASMWGVNHPEWGIQNYRLGSRYRRNFYRPWLFFELGPEVTWPKNENGHRNPAYAAMAGLEIQFGE